MKNKKDMTTKLGRAPLPRDQRKITLRIGIPAGLEQRLIDKFGGETEMKEAIRKQIEKLAKWPQ